MEQFELYRGELAQGTLPPAAVVGALDPRDDRQPQLRSGGPPLPIQDVALQQREERLHRGVVAALTG
jgi:hypothetical protein